MSKFQITNHARIIQLDCSVIARIHRGLIEILLMLDSSYRISPKSPRIALRLKLLIQDALDYVQAKFITCLKTQSFNCNEISLATAICDAVIHGLFDRFWVTFHCLCCLCRHWRQRRRRHRRWRLVQKCRRFFTSVRGLSPGTKKGFSPMPEMRIVTRSRIFVD